MKQLTLNLTVLVLLVTGVMTTVNACKHKQVAQNPVVVAQPSATPTPSATPVAVVCAEHPTIECPGFKFQGCDKFADKADAAAKALADGSKGCMVLDGALIYYGDGFGPCISCKDL